MTRFCVVGFFAAALTTEISADHVTVEIGKTRKIKIGTQVVDTRVHVEHRNVAQARVYDGRLEVRGITVGKTTVTFSGKVVKWVTGIPRHEPKRKGRFRPTPLREDHRFEDIVTVTVIERKTRAARPTAQPGDGVRGRHRRTMEVPLNKTKNVDFHRIGSRLRNVKAISADRRRVQTQGGGDWAQITGRAPGDVTVYVTGDCWTADRKWERFFLEVTVTVD